MMNERIVELAEQCGFRSNPNIYDRNQSFDIEKFAELIVRECATIARNTDLEDVDGGDSAVLREVANQIQKHFGVDK
jgi:hypothetical protein